MRFGAALLAVCLASVAGVAAAGDRPPAGYRSLAGEFPAFLDETEGMPRAARVAAFETRFDRLFPGFYEPAAGETQARFDARVAEALDGFPALRSRYRQVEQRFPQAFATATLLFGKRFPGFPPPLPIWFVHSLGRMDGGTRTLGGRSYMIFGTDVIARLHDDGTIGPFLDHELFHVENGRWFGDCDPDTTLWCALWQEGTAVYNASAINPGATDHMLMLDTPAPIRAAVDARWREAVCETSRDLDRTDAATYADYFLNTGTPRSFPRRWGYYVAYRMVQRVGRRYGIVQIDHLDHAGAHRVMTQALDAMAREAGGCG